MGNQDEFVKHLTKIYLQNPAGVLPNALWKTIAGLDEFETSFDIKTGGVSTLRIEGRGRLILQTPTSQPVTQANLQKYNFALFHEAQIMGLSLEEYIKTAYFRLVHRHVQISPAYLPEGFEYSAVDMEKEAGEIAYFLNQCYPGMNQQPETILSWQQHPVFHPDLWIWIREIDSGRPAALGIAEFDPMTKEGSLEWVQVHSDYRRKGLGSVVVNELLRRLSPIADFSTVSGQVDNATRPEMLYRKCGFEGEDIWWVLVRDS